MKRYLSLLIAISLSAAAHSRVLTLNNNNPSPGQYTTWSDVYGATFTGDTILVHESPLSYGSLNISYLNKSLVIIGAGHRPQTAGQYGCFFDNLNIYWTGGNTLRIYGIRFTYGNLSYAGGTTIERCYFSHSDYYLSVNGQSDGVTLRSCIFKGYLSVGDDSGVTNLTVTNCYFETTPGGYCLSGMNGGGSKVFTGNLYMGKGSGVRQMVPSWGSMRNMIVTNSIFYGVSPRGGGINTDLLFSNNLVYGSSDDNMPAGSSGSGNLTGTDPGFVSVPAVGTVTGFDYSYDYCLREDSPARGAGGGGVDLGLYPVHGREFSLRGEPERPFTMTVLPSNAVIPFGGSTNVSFTIRQGNLSGGCTGVVGSTPVCRARISATEYKNFMCYNLGASNTSADPFTPGWEVNGGYWQWGRVVQAAAGPTGPGSNQANESPVSGWNTANAANGSWSDTYKTADDPCPAGYRVPTQAQWQAVTAHNTRSDLGTWSYDSYNYTNYSAGVMFGSELMLPAAGYRGYGDGALYYHGDDGGYWSSTEIDNSIAWDLYFVSSDAYTSYNYRAYGLSVRCVAE